MVMPTLAACLWPRASKVTVWLGDGTLISDGRPLQRNQFVRYTGVQEESKQWGTEGYAITLLPYHTGPTDPSAFLRFTDFDGPRTSSAGDSHFLYFADADWAFAQAGH
jgi:hypothetical protein